MGKRREGKTTARESRSRKKCLAGIAAAAVLFGMLFLPSGERTYATGSRSFAGADAETAEWIAEAGEKLGELAAEREIMALVYLADEYPVKMLPDQSSETVVTVYSGQQVFIRDVYVDEAYQVWEAVRLEYNGMEYSGYVQRDFLAVSDSRFLEWEETYGMNPGTAVFVAEDGETHYADIEQFPESYREALTALKQQHPGWTFVKMNTTLDWNTVIAGELGAKSLVHKSLPDWTKNGLYDTGSWYYATGAAVKKYMDPRNSLTEKEIFQFEQLTYNEEYHTLEAMKTFLNNTFMNDSSPAPGMDTMTFAEMFWYIGKEEGREVSPFHLAARVLQEQGQGTSPLISGVYPGYEGYYNYFNIGASGQTDQQVIESGLSYARDKGWTSAYLSVLGGADFVSANYIKKGQDTLYLQKFNVNPNGAHALYTHQYMQNISAPTTEARSIYNLYDSAASIDSTFVFKIPVYENMPEEPCGEPEEILDISLTLPEGYTDTTVWLDGVAYAGTMLGDALTVTAADQTAQTAIVYRYNEAGVPEGMYVWMLSYAEGRYSVTPQPELEDLLTYHGFSIRITGKSGIRFKTGISVALRNRLTSTGVDGYMLKEYGTLAMKNENRAQYPMTKGGAKVQGSMTYGTEEDGSLTDIVYETVDERYRYTGVLVGMPAAQYKTEMAFRGYIILEKDGGTVTLYGSPVARSIYALAGQFLERGSYEPGSAAYEFLTKLISDADALEAAGAETGGIEQIP